MLPCAFCFGSFPRTGHCSYCINPAAMVCEPIWKCIHSLIDDYTFLIIDFSYLAVPLILVLPMRMSVTRSPATTACRTVLLLFPMMPAGLKADSAAQTYISGLALDQSVSLSASTPCRKFCDDLSFSFSLVSDECLKPLALPLPLPLPLFCAGAPAA